MNFETPIETDLSRDGQPLHDTHDYVPEAAIVRMLKFATDCGLPVVIGTDAHTKDRILAFEVAERRLELAGLTTADLYMPQVEDFMARKGRRSDPKSRPAPGRSNR